MANGAKVMTKGKRRVMTVIEWFVGTVKSYAQILEPSFLPIPDIQI